jgi:excinuclease ABC subunit C
MTQNSWIEKLLKSLPDKPGVYQYYDTHKNLLYVGKAKNLKKRVSSYFNKAHDSSRLRMLVKQIADIKTIVVETEWDALLLENSLIKQHQPKYNINLKDDKTYPWIVIKSEPFPRIFPTRRKIKDGSIYLGPYASVKTMHTMLDLVKQLYPLRTCKLSLTPQNIASGKFSTCLEFHIGRCKAPCVGKQSQSEYNHTINQIVQILKGNYNELMQLLKLEMRLYAESLEFEKAQDTKLKIDLLEQYQSKSTIVSTSISKADVFSIEYDSRTAFINYLAVKDGVIVQSYTLEMRNNLEESESEILQMAIVELRSRFESLAKEIIIPYDIDLQIPGVELHIPQKGDRKKLLELSQRNAKHARLEKLKQAELKNPELRIERLLQVIKADLRLKELPKHIECFDNSNFQGDFAVSACVVFKNAKPSKKDYRHFNVKTVIGPDDFATMREVVYRRYKRLLDEEQEIPQLIVIDGGKGQLGAAVESLTELNLMGKVAVICIAKRLEELYFPGDSIPLYLDKKSETLRVIQHMRDEAHRFGITHHRNKRSKGTFKTELTEIDGIGEKLANELLKEFKSVKNITRLGIDDLSKVLPAKKAEAVFNYFRMKMSKE